MICWFLWTFGAVFTTVLTAYLDSREEISLNVEGWEWMFLPILFCAAWPLILFMIAWDMHDS